MCKDTLSANVGQPSAEKASPLTGFTVVVLDSEGHTPLQLARVALMRGTALVQGHVTDPSGQAVFHDVQGSYTLVVRSVGYKAYTAPVTILDQSLTDTVLLSVVKQNEVLVTSSEIPNVSVDLQTGNQVFDAATYHAPPQDRITALVQQSVAGAARAPTGEVHVRGQHGEFTYYIDGIPVPLGVFGGLNEVIDPSVIDRVTFLTGGFPAEYGGQIAAVMDVQTRVPEGNGIHLDAEEYTGSYLPNGSKSSIIEPDRFLNSNGQSLALSDHSGPLSFYLSGSRQETDRRIDPPVSTIFHDHGFDYFLFGKADYILTPTSYLSMNLNYGITATQVPYDSAEGIMSDFQTATNAFQTLSYFNTLSSDVDHEQHFFAGVYAREGGLVYTPGSIDPPTFQFAGDTTNYNLAENRAFTTLGTRVKYDASLSHQFAYAVGANFSTTTGQEHFTSTDSLGSSGPSQNTSFAGSDFGLFAQAQWHPLEWTRFDVGVRYDQHIAPDIALTNQVSPRVKWNFFIDESNTAYLYYGRLFMPNNIEGLQSIASAATGSNTTTGTLPERDQFYEAVYSRSWGYGVSTKVAGFYKLATPGVDDQTIGSSALKTPVNIDTVKTSGIEFSLSFSDPNSPFSAYVNSSIIHAYGSGGVVGGFLGNITNDGAVTDLDHDQRLSVVLGTNYQPENWFVNAQAIYGSGLTNGNPDNLPYQSGLFDFNQAEHTTPSWILNISGGYIIHLSGGETIAPSLYITNLLGYQHLIKGAYFSAASWEEPRNIVLRVAFHI
jgi:outer membrane receptor protein involved in Fe transport